ncbi:unnamed protein product [Bursaphelenchus okinawaensis]|uniref:Phospholipase A2 n=1 Tax=Bursaphelenchus okinawaensis TaxID=465554 RepID=A0A811KUJ9_9BILA|nr:unnamed protein product [Bursaphelenchus okinawaensis]CAG9112345.1 unnamed protein product [Bursaphelenchus okinawaensis]
MRFLLLSILPVLSVEPVIKALWNLNAMAECRLGYTALVYNNYGCWCGVGGAHTPMDPIDDCCRRHDKCYDAAIAEKACPDVPIEYVEDYDWVCNKTIDTRPQPTCTESSNMCKNYMCNCDQMVVDCWSQYSRPSFKVSCTHHDKALAKAFFDAILN